MNNYRKRISLLNANDPLDYKDIDLLKKFVTEQGKILPRRLTGLTVKQQKKAAQAIKRARMLAYLPFVSQDIIKIN
uniref:ribosomal protein S18 n=1 Tax=Pseudoerythrocladia kornmannii TaxID=753682 RepID=UPI001BF12DDD|nr:ribosomal protein S18 [Pseudoerythrocladia kornmannii]QUE28333.1 ribosomal protein S18 [Pseudoerythrocladia kornmannii]UNJ16838.1 ribosomal protein S18 [Pseudoerythrocladia kornmannii]